MKAQIENLKIIQEKDVIVATFVAEDLREHPSQVKIAYESYNATHIEIGEFQSIFNNLQKWITRNKGAAVGSVVGGYGYGKTSFLVHLWACCRLEGILAIPPFQWKSTGELIDGIYGWSVFEFSQKAAIVDRLHELYEKTTKKSLEKLAIKLETTAATMRKNLTKSELARLTAITPQDILKFLESLTELAEEAGFNGLVVFTDELQETLNEYESVPRFCEDLFGLVNGLVAKQGNYGIIFGIPEETLTLLLDQRSDIVDRLKSRQIYVKCEDIYDRRFPSELWEKYTEIFELNEVEIVDTDTLDAIAQISFKKGFGAGPRGVVEVFKRFAEVYINHKRKYTPIDMIDDYLNGNLTLLKSPQLVSATRDILHLEEVQDKPDLQILIKLLAAYPLHGCKMNTITKYHCKDIFDEIRIRYYGNTIVELKEGFTLAAFVTDESTVQAVHDRILRNFTQIYARSDEQIKHALDAFCWIIPALFPEAQGVQIFNAWRITDNESLDSGGFRISFEGAFDRKYPFRQLILTVTTDSEDFEETEFEGIIIDLLLDLTLGRKAKGEIRVKENRVSIKLNPQVIIVDEIPIPAVKLYPEKKIDPIFLLNIMYELGDNNEIIPNSEKSIVEYYIEHLQGIVIANIFSDDLRLGAEINISNFGNVTLREVIDELCKNLYPEYETMIKSANWEKSIASYTSLVKDSRVPASAKRGSRKFEITREDLGSILGTKNWQALNNRLSQMTDFIENLDTDDRNQFTLKLRLHPIETVILDYIKSGETRTKSGYEISYVKTEQIRNHCRIIGYIEKEVSLAIELLCARSFIRRTDGEIEQIVESLEERKLQLINWKTRIVDNSSNLANLIDESLLDEMGALPEIIEIETASDISELDAIEETLSLAERVLSDTLIKASSLRSAELDSLSKILDLKIMQSEIKELRGKIKGIVIWAAELEQCRMTLESDYNKLLGKMKSEKKIIVELRKKFDLAKSVEDRIRVLAEAKDVTRSKIDGIETVFAKHLEEYKSWIQLLEFGDEVKEKTISLEIVHKQSDLKQDLNKINTDISKLLQTQRVSALSEHEIYKKKIEEILKKAIKREKERRTVFNNRKSSIEEILSKMGISENKLRSMYDHQMPQESFDNMLLEATEKLQNFLVEMKDDIQRTTIDLQYAKLVLDEDCTDQLRNIKNAMTYLTKADKALGLLNLDDQQSVIVIEDYANKAYSEVTNARTGYRQLVKAGSPSKQERMLFDKIDKNSRVHLRELVISAMDDTVEDFEWETFMNNLLNLFKKNLINLDVSRR